ncbi:L-threonine 3-dehydrogenase [Anoxybacter fermentans]|uniref:L-threonine 3-dehydrogenase n=1 Tax=Anoxybacter fermentans TaxID=1323375 RepID=A0A3S9SUJ8_9FIRM|nr:L-threonine 3-dehydrogenase [Anoxybacter fermentans]AZR71939.1 L-threonine 3-dehydrogenase [Anoxybacter fermentans]
MTKMMWAVVKTKPAPGGELIKIPIPEIGPKDVLVKVAATSICGTDFHIYEWNKWAAETIKTPQVMGHELAGYVVKVGEQVTSLKEGDFISTETHIPCLECYQCKTGRMHICQDMKIFGVHQDGVFAEYAVVPEVVAWKNDPDIPRELASIQEPLGNAIDTILTDDIVGKTVFMPGVGPLGQLGILVAKACGVGKLIVSDINPYRLERAKELGADVVLDATKDDVVETIMEITQGIGVDVVAEMSGSPIALKQGLKVLTPGGRLSLLGLFNKPVDLDLNNDVIFKGITVHGITGRRMFETWHKTAGLIKSGRVDFSRVITHTLPLEKWEEGMKLMESGNCGKIVLTVD